MAEKAEGVAMLPKKTDNRIMETFKNYLIALLMAIIALLLVTQPAQSAGKSKEAKAIEYAQCLKNWADSVAVSPVSVLDNHITNCAKYRP